MKRNLNNNSIIILIFALLSVLAPLFIQACTPFISKPQSVFNGPDWSFRENKGQLVDENNKPVKNVPYYGWQGGVRVYCKRGEIVFVFAKEENAEKVSEATGFSGIQSRVPGMDPSYNKTNNLPSTIRTNRAELQFLNANQNVEIGASKPQDYYENYYNTGDANHGITYVHTFKTITYKNIYPNIDLILQSKPNGLEYSFIVYPGGDVADIQIKWNGLDNIKHLENGGVLYSFALGNMTETAPVSFEKSSLGNLEISSSFDQYVNHVGFLVANYDKTKTLVIDPTLSWGTYFGASTTQGKGIIAEANNNVYLTGDINASSSIGTSGAYQTNFAGGGDAFVANFTSTGSLNWATYYGGSKVDCGNVITLDENNNVYIAGYTASTSGIATSGTYKTSLTGDTNAFIAKFSSTGSLIWGTYYGGTKNDQGWGITADKNNNIYITGFTNDSAGIATSGAYKTNYSGNIDAFVAKFTSAGGLAWATYYGGNGNEQGSAIVSDNNNNIYVTGSTNDTDGIATSGAYRTSYGGGGDAFVAKFTSSGNLSWGTYYGGSLVDYATGIATINNNVYITGTTYSTQNIATKNAWLTSNSAYTYMVFIANFKSTGDSLLWGTYYGGNGHDFGGGITADVDNNVYITGQTYSQSGIVTSGSYSTSLPSTAYYVAFLAKFNPSGNKLLYGTYIGNSIDNGEAVTIDANNLVYVTGETSTTSGLATSGSYQTSNIGWDDAFLMDFNFNKANHAGIVSLTSPASGICQSKEHITIQLENFGSDTLKSDSIYWKINGIAQTPVKWTGRLATYSSDTLDFGNYSFIAGTFDTIVFWTSKPNSVTDSVPGTDTMTYIVTVNPYPIVNAGNNKTLCEGTYDTLGSSTMAGHYYSWSSKPGRYTNNNSNPSVAPTTTTTYYLTEYITATGCNKSDSVVINVNPLPLAKTGKDSDICLGDSTRLGDTVSVAGNTYAWSSTPGGFASSLSSIIVSPLVTTTYYLKDSITATGCFKKDSVVIHVSLTPNAKTGGNRAICMGDSISLGDSAVSGNSYIWSSSPTGFSSTVSNPPAYPTSTTTFYIKETVAGGGCFKSDSVVITVNPLPSAKTRTDTFTCSGSIINLGAVAVSGDTYSWTSNPQGFTSTSANPIVNPTMTITYYLTEIITATGCNKSDSMTVKIKPLPDANAGTDSTICPGDKITISGQPVVGNYYSWVSNPSGLKSTSFDPLVAPTVTTTYYLTVKSQTTGCKNSDSVTIYVFPISGLFTDHISDTTTVFFPADTVLASYDWSFGDGKTDTSVKPIHIYPGYGKYIVKLTVKNSIGCSKTNTTTVNLSPIKLIAKFSSNDTNCVYSAVSFSDSSISDSCGKINNWLWSFGDGDTSSAQNPMHTFTTPGVFAVKLTVLSSGGCTDSIARNIFVDSNCVWPGDANNNKLVEITDILNIGIAFNDSGPSRGVMNNNWTGKYCDNWGKTFINGVDYKHSDCNGDGVVDSLDLMAISINWGDSHKKTGLTSGGNPSDPPFYLAFSKATYNPGDTVKAAIILGTPSNSLGNVYGMASEFNFDLAYIDTNTLKVNFSKSWFGTPGTDMLYFFHPEYSIGKLFFAISRIDHNNKSGNGNIGTVSFIIPKNASANNSINFTAGSAKLIAFNQTSIPVYLPIDTYSVNAASGIQNPLGALINLSVAPNPFSTLLSIAYTLPEYQNVLLSLIDITGKQIASLVNENETQGQHIYVLDAEKFNIPAGIYFLRMVAGDDAVEEKVVRIK